MFQQKSALEHLIAIEGLLGLARPPKSACQKLSYDFN